MTEGTQEGSGWRDLLFERRDRRARMAQGAAAVTFLFAVNLALQPPQLGSGAAAWGVLALLFAVVAAAGAVGGWVYHATESLRTRGGWRGSVANILSLLAYSGLIFGLFVGFLYLSQR